ncbi:hypothetical protein BOTBODRAFT_35207 [Botryobasidium botryosum FD-172 SS1]|uniref:Uncharacterized protein n=1 Tax=Botryobasidium botryosum (strain FD-172 SS1) TaxID=930990 RepID=A0A067MA04_BOTB1|nr:hypothetical protein BOTBODRAFT_35207 [Botryobasidium botryosum FD-172 SS1]
MSSLNSPSSATLTSESRDDEHQKSSPCVFRRVFRNLRRGPDQDRAGPTSEFDLGADTASVASSWDLATLSSAKEPTKDEAQALTDEKRKGQPGNTSRRRAGEPMAQMTYI